MTIRRFGWVAAAAVIAAAACKGGVATAPDTPAATPQAAAATGKPKIACDQAEHDYGTVAQGEQVTHTFKVRNAGDAPLKIESARGG
ncbi:MAG: DUF1573 domain-containing protein [Deltaproteobacteria bacterium]|nr:DUF1573 domain-containing protein [Deltaproteobacteria bacterium]